MKLTVERDAALKALAHVQSIAKPRATVPILANLKLETGATTLCFTANNMDLQASDSCAATIATPGAITVEAKRLFDMIRAFPSGGQVALEIKPDDPRLVVHCGRSRSLLPTLPAEDFPQFPSLENGDGGLIERDLLARLLRRTRFAASSDETRYTLNGVYLHVVDRGGEPWLTAAASDRFTIAVAEAPAPADLVGIPGALLPSAACDEIARLLGDAPEEVEFRATRHLFELRCGDAEIVGKLVDLNGGGWVAYSDPFGFDVGVALPLDHELLGACIGRMLLVCDDKSNTMRVEAGPGSMVLTAQAGDGQSTITDEIDISYDGPDFQLGLNAKHVKAVLAQVGGENAVFNLRSPPGDDPIVVHDSSDPDCRYLLVQARA